MNSNRQFLFTVKPHDRETSESYTRRLLERNFELESLPAELLKERTGSRNPADKESVWLEILRDKTGRDHLNLSAHRARLCGSPGERCEECESLVPARWRCTRCTHGQRVQQHAHFDDLVCERHNSWVGLSTPENQTQVDNHVVTAHRRFRKLRRRGVINPRHYDVLDRILQSPRIQSSDSPAERFVHIVNLTRVLTDPAFQATVFNPATPYRDSYAQFKSVVNDILGQELTPVPRLLWLYLRATAAAVRSAVQQRRPYAVPGPHQFPLPAHVVARFPRRRVLPDDFAQYLAVANSQFSDALEFSLNYYPSRDSTPQTAVLCAHGHEYLVTTRRGRVSPSSCPACGNLTAVPGINDIATIDPEAAKEFDRALNGGICPTTVPAGSQKIYNWRCAKGHAFPTSPANRTRAKGCPVCSNRHVIAGINDLATTHPHLAAEWCPTTNLVTPDSVSAGSNRTIHWLCESGHSEMMRVFERVSAHGCLQCQEIANPSPPNDLTVTHPDLAEQWHPTWNGELFPNEFTHGSNYNAAWRCDRGHDYRQRIDRRSAGGGCGRCSKRTRVSGINDIATTDPELATEWHPYLNLKPATDVYSTIELVWWRCRANSHDYRQTVDHRRKSRGCPQCAPGERIAAANDLAIDAGAIY